MCKDLIMIPAPTQLTIISRDKSYSLVFAAERSVICCRTKTKWQGIVFSALVTPVRATDIGHRLKNNEISLNAQCDGVLAVFQFETFC